MFGSIIKIIVHTGKTRDPGETYGQRASHRRGWAALAVLSLLLVGCDGGDEEAPFTLSLELDSVELNAMSIEEGNPEGIDIPFAITRQDGYLAELDLDVSSASVGNTTLISSRFISSKLIPPNNSSSVNLKLDIGALPISARRHEFRITASDGTNTQTIPIVLNVVPVDAPDVYLLVGQSNMVGFGGEGGKEDGSGQPDEPNERIKQLNVTKNSEQDVFTTPGSYTSITRIAVGPNYIVRAEDPLHLPLDTTTNSKSNSHIGLGMSFAKQALQFTDKDIVLVPAAYSSTSFCDNSPVFGHWNAATTPGNSTLGNTLMFDRAVARTNLALAETGGILRGILWHQGESDAECADTYADNLLKLVTSFRTEIDQDARGAGARGATANIPFVTGSMSMGINEQGDYSLWPDAKRTVDAAHRMVGTDIPYAAFSNHDDLTPANGFPCGLQSCVHFGSAALREMGIRYHDALMRAASRAETGITATIATNVGIRP